jgi:quercetin dioxygenase-like cupin family protein
LAVLSPASAELHRLPLDGLVGATAGGERFICQLEEAIRSQVNEGPVTTYNAGQSFSERPGDRHDVSAKASKTKPTKLLAVFVVDTHKTEPTQHRCCFL